MNFDAVSASLVVNLILIHMTDFDAPPIADGAFRGQRILRFCGVVAEQEVDRIGLFIDRVI